MIDDIDKPNNLLTWKYRRIGHMSVKMKMWIMPIRLYPSCPKVVKMHSFTPSLARRSSFRFPVQTCPC